MRRIWATLPFWNESDMLRMYLEEVADKVHKIVITESPVTFGGDAKPLYYNPADFPEWADKIIQVTAPVPDTRTMAEHLKPWAREYAQRDAAWQAVLKAGAGLDDVVIIGDVDEIPSRDALAWRGWPVATLKLRTALFAVDWLVPQNHILPPMTVMATVRHIGSRGGQLAQIRESRFTMPVIENGGWHFSWVGGPAAQALKLETGTSHTEIRDTAEGASIRAGLRWSSGAAAGGIPVEPATVDDSWPAFIRERRCPPEWFRPADGRFVKAAAADPWEVQDYLWAGFQPGKLAFEVGANQGATIPKLQQRYGRVIAFEPYKPNWEIARLVPGSDVRLSAVSAFDDMVVLVNVDDQLISPGHEAASRLDLSQYEDVAVPSVSLDTVTEFEGVPDFINVDVEGHEVDVLRGAQRLLAAGKTSWLIEFHSKPLHDGCVKLLEESGCKTETVRHPHYKPGSEFYEQHGWIKAVPCVT